MTVSFIPPSFYDFRRVCIFLFFARVIDHAHVFNDIKIEKGPTFLSSLDMESEEWEMQKIQHEASFGQ